MCIILGRTQKEVKALRKEILGNGSAAEAASVFPYKPEHTGGGYSHSKNSESETIDAVQMSAEKERLAAVRRDTAAACCGGYEEKDPSAGTAERACIVCGTLYKPVRRAQKYCSAACRRYAGKHDIEERKEDTDAPAIRTFHCVRCGKLVRVTSTDDHRMKFCSKRCDKLYWKHSRAVEPVFVSREFDCRECGRHVRVENPLDLRVAFCSLACGRKWNVAQRNKNKH